MSNQPTLTFFQALPALPSQHDGQASARSASAKSSRIAKRSSKSISVLPTLSAGNKHNGYTMDEMGGSKNPLRGQTLRTLNASDAERGPHPHPNKKAGQHSLVTQIQASIPTFDNSTDDNTEELTCSLLEFPANPQVAPGSAEAAQMTVGFGRKLFESLVKHSRLSPCLKTLLGSLLLKGDWCSRGSYLRWKPTATKSARRLSFQLAASRPITTDTGCSLLPTLCAQDLKRGRAKEDHPTHPYSMTLRQVIEGAMPSLSATELNGGGTSAETRKENGHHVRLRDYLNTLANKRAVPDSHGNVDAWSGLKLTSSFCEAYQGFPQNWTAIDEPESMRSATQSCRRKSSRSSKQSAS